MFSFWRSRNRFSLDELKYLHGQLQKIQQTNDANKDFVIEILRSIAELVTYGDQHDPSIFEYFMDQQIMSQFMHILKTTKTASVSVQLLQTLSIMIQNLHSEHAIYYLFSNEHVNSLILYPFDFSNEELLNYYIYFLRAVSGKLNKSTISLLVKTRNDEVISFPLYTEAIKFVHHEENMIRIAVRALTLNIYHVTDESVHRFISSPPLADYFLNLVKNLWQQCLKLDAFVSHASKVSDSSQSAEKLYTLLAEIGDNLCYCNDIICAGVPCLSKLMSHHLLDSLILPALVASSNNSCSAGISMSASTSLYLLSFLLNEVQYKDLVNSIGVALLFPPAIFSLHLDSQCNGHISLGDKLNKSTNKHDDNQINLADQSLACCSNEITLEKNEVEIKHTLWQVLLSYIACDNEKLVLGCLTLLIALLQNKELDDSVLDALGILPQRKQHKKYLLQVLIGSKSDEEQLFSPSFKESVDEICNGLDFYLQKLKVNYQIPNSGDQQINPIANRSLVMDSIISPISQVLPGSSEVLWYAGYLLRQLLPYESHKLNDHHDHVLNDAYKKACTLLLRETRDCWCDLIAHVLLNEWRKCKKALESPDLERCSILHFLPEPEGALPVDDQSSSFLGERMHHTVKAFVLHRQLRQTLLKETIDEVPYLGVASDLAEDSRLKRAGFDSAVPKIGSEFNLGDAIPCRIAFERGKERHFYFLAVSKGSSGCMLLAEDVRFKPTRGVVRIVAPLAGANPRIDDKHPRWLHLRIRPFNLPTMDSKRHGLGVEKTKSKGLVDGRWILAFSDEETCKTAMACIVEEMTTQHAASVKELEPLLD